MNKNNYCVIMAGSDANHFWPVSKENRPKQFLNIPGYDKSLIRATYERFAGIVPKENIIVVTLKKHKELAMQHLPELPEENLLLEPFARRTAPCIAFANYTILKRNPRASVVVTPSDLSISNEEEFKKLLTYSLKYVADNNILLTLGIKPDRPDPNFGYIQIKGGRQADKAGIKPIKVKTFTEKPNPEIAKIFYNSGEFYWNSGIFFWKASVIKEELEKYTPEITSLFEGWDVALGSSAQSTFIDRAYADCPKLSIDYGVMEKTDKAWLLPGTFDWYDLNSWDTAYEVFPNKDENGNAFLGGTELFLNTKNNLVITKNKEKLIVINGLEDHMVIDTPDVLMICPREEKKFKEILANTCMPHFDKYK